MTGRKYSVRVKRSAEKELNRLPAAALTRIGSALLSLADDPRPRNSKKLRGTENYRIGVGVYRVLYSISDAAAVVEVISVGHRRDVYG
jgi:mRNA interferase RelE/StbE